MEAIKITGLSQNNLKNINIDIPKHQIVVFTGVSGSGKSSIVFDTIGAESQRQMNETYAPFIRNRLPRFRKPEVEAIRNLSPSVIVDQSPLGENIRSTVGTVSGLYADLRVLFSRIGRPYAGSAGSFSFNDPAGMCPVCSGLGTVNTIDRAKLLDESRSLNEGCILDSRYSPNSWYWKRYAQSGMFDMNKPVSQYGGDEKNLLLYGSRDGKSPPENPKVPGILNKYKELYLHRDISSMSKTMKANARRLIREDPCRCCGGDRLNQAALACKVHGRSIADLGRMELTKLLEVLATITEPEVKPLVDSLTAGLQRLAGIGLSYLHLNRETGSLSGGEAQRQKARRHNSL